tara:strand:+ start:1026 stop:1625 length:600 start_codon:yes stop_codon:yes gene_type:complete
MLLRLKSLILIIPILCQVHAASLAAAEGDCADCTAALVADTGLGSNNLATISNVTRAVAEVRVTSGEQLVLCERFLLNGLDALKEKAQEYGYELYQIYDQIKCDDVTQADLLKHRASIPNATSDIMSFARLYIRGHNDPSGLTRIFNTVIDNPGKPRGTLLDFIHFYKQNPRHSDEDRLDFEAYEATIRRFGGKLEAEL